MGKGRTIFNDVDIADMPLLVAKKNDLVSDDLKESFEINISFIFSQLGKTDLKSFNDLGGSQFCLQVMNEVTKLQDCIFIVQGDLFDEPYEIIFDGKDLETKKNLFKRVFRNLISQIELGKVKEDIFLILLVKNE